ncbi:MAG: carboxypeptidase-like regulatory domain-containing protein [Planctomycetes bacterium]|nr:carboxypeptidase-like regulatory domain-containing protein [Planctomycetota bacterium]
MKLSTTLDRRAWLWLGAVCALVAVAWLIVPASNARSANGTDAAKSVDRARALDLATLDESRDRTVASVPSLQLAALAQSDSKGIAGRITGVVRAHDGAPVAGARCVLSSGSSTWGFAVTAAPEAESETLSRPDGTFDLAAGDGFLRLEVLAAGHAAWAREHLVAGDVCDVRLAGAARLAISVHARNGSSLGGAEVALTASFTDLAARPLLVALTDGAGSAILDGVPPGTWFLRATHADFPPAVREISVGESGGTLSIGITLGAGLALKGVVRVRDGTPIDPLVRITAFSRGQSLILEPKCDLDGRFETAPTFTAGEGIEVRASSRGFGEVERAIRVTTDAGTLELVLEKSERRVRGSVVDVSDAPLAGALVLAQQVPPFGRGKDALTTGLKSVTYHAERWRRAATTAADGSFEIARLAEGEQHVLMIVAQNFAPRIVWVPVDDAGSTEDVGAVVLEAACGLFGTARFAAGELAVGRKLAATLSIVVKESAMDSAWRPKQWWRSQTVVTAEGGRFRFDQLAPGKYDLAADGHALTTIEVDAGEIVGPIDVVVPREDLELRARECTVEGELVSDASEPIEGAWIGVFDVPASGGIVPLDSSPVAMTFSGPRGDFKLRVPAAGRWIFKCVDVRGAFVASEQAFDVRKDGEAMRIVLEASKVELEPLIGLVLGPDGKPRAGLEVTLEPPENQYCGCVALVGHTDGDGQVVFEHLTDRDHHVRVTDPSGELRPATYFPARPGGYFEIVLEE